MTEARDGEVVTEQLKNHRLSMEKLAVTLKGNNTTMLNIFTVTQQMLVTIIDCQGQELALFKEFEQHMRDESLTEEILVDFLARLQELRDKFKRQQEKVLADRKAAADAAK